MGVQDSAGSGTVDPAGTAMDDNEIIRRVLEGEKDLYALLIRKYNQRLFRVGLSIVNNRFEVEDVMQAVYMKAYENLSKFRFQSAFSTWITKILVNESLLFVRTKQKAKTREVKNYREGTYDEPRELDTPLMKVLNMELKTILEGAIRELPEKYRTVFIMRELANMNIAEITACLELSESNVKIRLNRARVMLRNRLSEYLKDDTLLELYQSRCDKIVTDVMNKIYRQTNQSTFT